MWAMMEKLRICACFIRLKERRFPSAAAPGGAPLDSEEQ
jgi:hypothetical protein